MKLSLSKEKPRHLVLDLEPRESYNAVQVIRDVILGDGIKPVLEALPGGGTRARFHRRFFLKVFYTFPFAELSPGVRKHIDKLYIPDDFHDVPDFEIPGFTRELLPFQRPAAWRITQYENFMLNDEMGLGKTTMALAAMKMLDIRCGLIVCPNNAKFNWAREIEEYTDFTYSVVIGTPEQREEAILADVDLVITNPETLRIKKEGRGNSATYEVSNPAFFDIQWDMLVSDEYHRFKNPTAQQTRGFFELSADRHLLMSGTPFTNRIEEIFSAMHKLNPKKYNSHWHFENNLLIRGSGGYTVAYQPHEVKRIKDEFKKNSVRRRKEMVRDDFPEVFSYNRPVELGPEQRRLYNQIFHESQIELESGEKRKVPTMLAMITRLKQAAFSPELYDGSQTSAKITELKEIVEELVANGEKAIVFTGWAKAGRIIERELAEYNPAYVDGSVKDTAKRQRRMEQIDKFNNDDSCKVYIGTIGANKEAINLGAATYVIFTDKDWVPTNNQQAIARSAAGGLRGLGEDKVTVINLVAVDTIEERIEELLKHKSRMFNAFVEDDSGRNVDSGTIKAIADLFRDPQPAEEAA